MSVLPYISREKMYEETGYPWTWKRFVWRLQHWGEAPWQLLPKPSPVAVERHGPTGTYGHILCTCVESCRPFLPTSFEHLETRCDCEACSLAHDDYWEGDDWNAVLPP